MSGAQKTELSVAVVGGGIGGMATAAVLHSIGLQVTVFEQSQQLGEIGAGIAITPNSVRLMAEVPGLLEAVDRYGVRYGNESAYRRADGSKVAPLLIADSEGKFGSYGMHRADVLHIFAQLLPAEQIRTASRCVAVTSCVDAAQILTEDGRKHYFDVVIGADGIHSVARQFVAGPDVVQHSGVIAYRGLVPMELLPNWSDNTSDLWMGEGKHFLTYPVRSGQLMNYVGFVPSGMDLPESWSAPGDVDQLRQAFQGWDPRISHLLSQIDSTFWWSLNDREPIDTWVRGRVVLMGDAAHPMLPHLGQGANQAIEDAFALRDCFIRRDEFSTISELFEEYQRLRMPRATRIQQEARTTGNRFDTRGEFADPQQRDSDITNLLAFRRWIFDNHNETEHISTV